jgi:hypothetical protein
MTAIGQRQWFAFYVHAERWSDQGQLPDWDTDFASSAHSGAIEPTRISHCNYIADDCCVLMKSPTAQLGDSDTSAA